MARGRGRGGYQQPTNPAPVSGPSAMSRRTDGGPGSEKRPLNFTGLPYGEAGQLQEMAAAAPTPAAAPGGMGSAPAGGPPAGAPSSALSGLAPSPLGAPDPAGPRMVYQDDPDDLLRALAAINPHPDLYRLMKPGL